MPTHNNESIKIETVAIGDELLVGKISDTNSQSVAKKLFDRGLRLYRQTVVADDLAQMTQALKESAERSQAVIVFGGLGPTSDDKTAECAAKILQCPLVEHAPSRKKLEDFLAKRGRSLTTTHLKQVLYPEKAQVIPNPKGLAPGFTFPLGKATLYFLPGVPMEMEAMVAETVLPALQHYFAIGPMLSHVWRCLGIPESQLQEAMDPIEQQLPEGCYLGYRTTFPENHLTLYWKPHSSHTGSVSFEEIKGQIRKILLPWAYAESDTDIEQVLVEELIRQNKTIALVESCTGGLALQRLTRVPGASKVVWGGITAYQIQAKDKMLGVKLNHADDAVSQACSTQLAQRVKDLAQSALAGAITGFMGPSHSESDPVGTVYISVIGKQEIEKKYLIPASDRSRAQWGASSYLIQTLLEALLSQR